MKTDPARVQGSEKRAIAYFIEDSRGDLVDIEYHCEDCYGTEVYDYLPWPAFDFGDGGAYCHECGEPVAMPIDAL